MFYSIMFKNPYKKEKKYFSHQTTRLNKTTSISFSTSKKKSPRKKVLITQRSSKSSNVKKGKKKRQRARFSFIHPCRKLHNSVPGRWLTKGYPNHWFSRFRRKAENRLRWITSKHNNGSYMINNGGSRIVSSVIIHPPPPQPTRDSIIRTLETKTQRPFPITDAMLLASFPNR